MLPPFDSPSILAAILDDGKGGRFERRRLEETRPLFEQMLSDANHVGFFAEETGPRAEALGSFPQAFTRLAVISAAFNLDGTLGAGN